MIKEEDVQNDDEEIGNHGNNESVSDNNSDQNDKMV